jgi:hypothetical protein
MIPVTEPPEAGFARDPDVPYCQVLRDQGKHRRCP